MRVLRLGAVLTAVLAGCGDPAVDGAYEGEALLQARGLLCAIGAMESPTTTVGIVWTTLGPDATRLASMPGEAQPVDASELPADFGFSLYERPPIGVATTIRSAAGLTAVSIGIPVLFDDLDGDGVLHRSDRFLGVGRGHVILYTGAETRPDGTEVSLAVDRIPAGFSIGQATCDAGSLTGFQLLPAATRIDVWVLPGVIENPIEQLAPTTCLAPF